MKGMTNNQIIMNEAAKLDPATLHAIATAHHTPEQIAAMAANAVTTDENGDEQPATIADVEIILAAAELHTFDHWKKEGKSVKKGETHLIECYLWKYTTRPSKAQREAAEAEGKEAAPAPHFYPTKSHLFSCLQVHDAKQVPAGRFGSVAAIMEYNKKLAAERKAAKAAAQQTASAPAPIITEERHEQPQQVHHAPQPPKKAPKPAPTPTANNKAKTHCRSWSTSTRCPPRRPQRRPASPPRRRVQRNPPPRRAPRRRPHSPPRMHSTRQSAKPAPRSWQCPKRTAKGRPPRWTPGARPGRP